MQFLSAIISLFMTISYFLASFGIGTNPAQKFLVVDQNGDPVSNAYIYYQSPKKNDKFLKLEKIGTTDEEGKTQWEHQRYGKQIVYVYDEEYQWDSSLPIGVYEVNVSRTAPNTILLELVEDYVYTPLDELEDSDAA